MNKPAIVFFLSSEWSRYHRPGLIRAIARAQKDHGPVLVVNNPVCLSTARWHRPERWRQWRSAAHMQTIDDNLILLDCAIPLHDKLASALPGAGQLNRRILAPQVHAALRELGLKQPLVTWFQFPTFCHYAGMLGEALPLYECYDEHSDVPGLSKAGQRRIVRLEKRLMAACGLVFTTSKPLFDARRTEHANVALTYNGADLGYFAPVGADSLQRVTTRRSAPPTVGYLGTIHEHTDLALLAEMAERCPDWRFILIGPVQPGADAGSLAWLRAAGNTELHGWVEESDLLEMLCDFDIGVIPYRSDARFNRYVNPNKLHEYTAMGKPVVVTPGIDVSSHVDAVTVAEGVDAFITAIAAQHAANSIEQVAQRLRMAAANSWDARAALMLAHIERTLEARATASRLPKRPVAEQS